MNALVAAFFSGLGVIAAGRFQPTPAETDPLMFFLVPVCLFTVIAAVITDFD